MKKFLLPTAMVAVLLSMPLVVSCSNSSDPVSDYLQISTYTSYNTKYPTPSAPTITVEKSEWTNGIKVKVSPGDNWSKCYFANAGDFLIYTDNYVCDGWIYKKADYETVIFKGKSGVLKFEVRVKYKLSERGTTIETSYYSDPYNFTYTPLTAPTGVTATKVDSSKAQISWNSTKAQSYKIYGGSDSNFESATLLATVEKDKTTCEVSNSFSYYWVQAYQRANTLSKSGTEMTYIYDSATSDPVHYTES